MVNLVLIVLSLATAHLFPYGGLLVAYAVLGPAHYLTEISWLHDRQYFTGWHRIGSHRAGMLVAVYGFILACDAVSFPLGVIVSLVLRHAHVMLELPLNVGSIRALLRPIEARG